MGNIESPTSKANRLKKDWKIKVINRKIYEYNHYAGIETQMNYLNIENQGLVSYLHDKVSQYSIADKFTEKEIEFNSKEELDLMEDCNLNVKHNQ